MSSKDQKEILDILRQIYNNPKFSQREGAKKIGLSLGKLNYCLNALKKKGLVKMKNFKKNKNKENYLYHLTPAGIVEKTKLTVNFMKRTMQEYDELKREIENVDNRKS
jgi:EPS-associated MarR family transcriptional regulator